MMNAHAITMFRIQKSLNSTAKSNCRNNFCIPCTCTVELLQSWTDYPKKCCI